MLTSCSWWDAPRPRWLQARRVLGYEPLVSLEDGIKDAVKVRDFAFSMIQRIILTIALLPIVVQRR